MVKAAEGAQIISVKITYTPNKDGVLTLNGENIASGTVVDVNAPSVTFGVGNTGTETKGQVRITEIEVVYSGEGTGEPGTDIPDEPDTPDVPVVPDGVIVNWGSRGDTATSPSSNAEAFYTVDYNYDVLKELAGSADLSAVSGSELYQALHTLMESNHTTYTTYEDVRYLFPYTDCVNGSTDKVSFFYTGTSVDSAWDGTFWSREHCWPKSHTVNDNADHDLMTLRPETSAENSKRGNKPYGENVGYNPNTASGGAYDLRGDVARIVLYTYVRWEQTNITDVIESIDLLLNWMAADPVDTWELGRNDSVQSITGTRNVFVDYPELAFLLFGKQIPTDMVTPSGEAGKADTPDTPDIPDTPVDPEEGNTAVSVSIADYAAANGWANGVMYNVVNLNEQVSVTATGTNNTGKYYTNGNEWRIYQTETPAVVVSAAEGVQIVSVKITYTSNKGGVLTLNGSNIESIAVVDVNAASVTFGVGNTGSANNGQVKITAIEVVYSSNTSGSEPDTPDTPDVPDTPDEPDTPVEKTLAEQLTEASGLANGAYLDYTTTIEGKVSEIKYAFSEEYGNISFYVDVEGTQVYCYRVKGEGMDTLAVGDTVKVEGQLTAYNGTAQFDKTATVTVVAKVKTLAEQLTEASGLANGAYLDYTTTIEGKVSEIKYAYSEEYNNITFYVDVEGTQVYCYRVKGEGMDTLAVGDTVKVEGKLTAYNGTAQFDKTAAVTVVEKAPATPDAPAAETVSVSIADYAAANGWANSVMYKVVNLNDQVSVTANGGANTGKYYTNGNEWRIYQTETPAVTVTAAEGAQIVSVKITYTSNKNGVLTLNGSNIDSGAVVDVNAASVTFGVGNTGSANNGQVRITAIEVIYSKTSNG